MNRHLLGMIIFTLSFAWMIAGIVTLNLYLGLEAGIGLIVGALLISFSDGLERRPVSRTEQRYTPEVKKEDE